MIFFNHPVKLGDYVKVLHKDYHFEGEVTEMNYFFVHLKTNDSEIITIPNSHFFDKSFSVAEKNKNIVRIVNEGIFLTTIMLYFSINTLSAQTIDIGSWNILNVKFNLDDKLSFLVKDNCVH